MTGQLPAAGPGSEINRAGAGELATYFGNGIPDERR